MSFAETVARRAWKKKKNNNKMINTNNDNVASYEKIP